MTVNKSVLSYVCKAIERLRRYSMATTDAINRVEDMSLADLVKLRRDWDDFEPGAQEDVDWALDRMAELDQEIAKRRAGETITIRINVTEGLVAPRLPGLVMAELERRYPGKVRRYDCHGAAPTQDGDYLIYDFKVREIE